jgi:hypothetical protein
MARHNQLDYNRGSINDLIFEYSVDENHIFKISNLKLQLNASYVQNNYAQKDTNRIGIQAKFAF